METQAPAAVRFFPHSDLYRLSRHHVSHDMAAQCKAVRQSGGMHALTGLVWTTSLTGALAGFAVVIGDQPRLAAVVLVASAAVAVVSWWAGGPLADAVRTADNEIGIPVPDDLAEAVAHSRSRFDSLGDRLAVAAGAPAAATALRPLLREIRSLDDRYTRCLHRARTDWAGGRIADWRRMAAELITIGDELARLDQLIPQR